MSVGAVWYLRGQPETTDPELELPPTAEVALEFDSTDISNLRIANMNGRSISFERDLEGSWSLEGAKPPVQIDEARLLAALTQAGALRSLARLAVDSDPEPLGLSQPSYLIEIELQDGTRHMLSVGGLTPTSSGYYTRIDGGAPQVVGKASLDLILELLSRPPFLNTPEVSPALTATAAP